jgi:TolA-binding protein
MRLFWLLSLLPACFTPGKEERINQEFHDVKTRIVELERIAIERGATTDASSKRIASTHSELERINLELQRIRGELDTLKVAAVNGELPGASVETDNVAKRIRDLSARMDAVEASAAQKSAVVSASKSQVSVKELKDAFNSKRFSFVTQHADSVIQRLKTKVTKEDIQYIAAESFFRLGKFKEAALRYNDFVEQHPGSQRLVQAKLRLGDSFKGIGEAGAAQSYYREIIAKYPKSPESTKAKEALEALEAKGASRYNRPGQTKLSESSPSAQKKM